jgi:multidrug resistance efflux pump
MIRQLRNRRRVDVVKPETRSSRARWGRLIYIGLLMAFLAGLANYLFGSFFFLRAPGLVLQAQYTVAPPYEARILKINVRPGEAIDPERPLVEVESPVLAKSIADLSLRQAELKSKVEQLRSKLVFTETMLPIAREQAASTQRSIDSLNRLAQQQLASLKRREDVSSANYTARSQLAELQTQKASLQRELDANQLALLEAERAYTELKRLYNGGRLFAPASGVVGAQVSTEGEVLVPGNRVLTIYSGEPYVLAYLPANYAFPVRVGQKVEGASGSRSVVGTIRSVLAIADALPAEFQSGLKPRDRSQLVRIELADESGFAVQQQVLVSSCMTRSCETWREFKETVRSAAHSGGQALEAFARFVSLRTGLETSSAPTSSGL